MATGVAESERPSMDAEMRVSVVIPTHNRANEVLRAVESVLNQSRPAAQVIVVDDGSTDDTPDRIRGLGAALHYVFQPHQGVSAARNLGARMAAGNWLAFLDSDDVWLPVKLERQCALHSSDPTLAISQTGEIWIRNGVRVNACKHHAKPYGDIFDLSLRRCLVSPSAVMIRRDLFLATGGFDEGLAVCEDYDLWLRLAITLRFGLVSEPLIIKHGGHADQLSRRYWGMDRFRVRSIAAILRKHELSPQQRGAAVQVLVEKCAVLSKGARRRGRVAEAESYESIAAEWSAGQGVAA